MNKDNELFEIENGVLTKVKNKDITEAVIPEGVTEIGAWAFAECTNLKSITIPSSVTKIGYSAFSSITPLINLIPESVSAIHHNTFDACKNLEEVFLSEGLEEIENYAFCGCKSIKKIILPKTMTKIGKSAFYNCNSLESVIISSKVKVKRNTFCKCSPSLTFYTPEGKKTDIDLFVIEDGILHGVTKDVTEAVIPEGVTEIEDYAFTHHNLEKVTIPKSVSKIGVGAFSNCEALEEIIIPEGVKVISPFAFIRCNSIKKIILPKSMTKIWTGAFWQCNSLESVIISSKVKIERKAFCSCSPSLAFFTPDGKKTDIDLFVIKDNELYGIIKDATEVVIPEGVVEIGDSAFSYHNLEKVTIPKSVKKIKDSAFENCESLKSIDIPEGVTKINRFAFRGCKSLKEVILPESVKKIGGWAFEDCKSLTNVTIPKNVEFDKDAFSGCTSLKSLTTHDGEEIPLPN